MNDLFNLSILKSQRVNDVELNSLRKSGIGGVSSAKSDLQYDIEQGGGSDEDLNTFFKEEKCVREKIIDMKNKIEMIRTMNEEGKNLTTGKTVKEHSKKIEQEIKEARQRANSIKGMLIDLMKDNGASAKKTGCGKGTPTFKTRQHITEDLCQRFQDRSKELQALIDKINDDEREMTKRRYITITGEIPDESMIEKLNTPTDRERFLRAAVQGQGTEKLKDFLVEMEERSHGMQGLIQDLLSLQEIFRDMAALVESQGELLSIIEGNVDDGIKEVEKGNEYLEKAISRRRCTRKCRLMAYLISVIIAVVLFLVIYLFLKNLIP